MRPPIYEPKGKAKEYGDYALNIYDGCPHGCAYCYVPNVLHKDRVSFHLNVAPRPGIYQETARQLEKEKITGKTIFLCFTGDPYPKGFDTSITRELIKLLKEYGNHVQILTKGDGSRDFDLLDKDDWYGITYAGYRRISYDVAPEFEPGSAPVIRRLAVLERAHNRGIKTWVSMEPVIETEDILRFLGYHVKYIDRYKIGKLNYVQSNTDWKKFGLEAEAICQQYGLDYYIKESLRAEMQKDNG